VVIGSGAFSLRLGAGQMTASALIAGFTVLNCLGVGRTAKVQNVLTSTKLVVIAGFVILGFAAGTGDWQPLFRACRAHLHGGAAHAVHDQPAVGDGGV
jgi:amino acid transporter